MKKSTRIVLIILVFLLIIYLCISAKIVWDFLECNNSDKLQEYSFPAFERKSNVYRTIVGLPKTYSSYAFIPSIYIIRVVARLLLVLPLMYFNITSIKKLIKEKKGEIQSKDKSKEK